jgi:hypothetical protein
MNIDQIIKAAADKFCGWKLPKDFYPDCFISFDREKAFTHPYSGPTGTNLFTHAQAQEMFRYCLAEDLAAIARAAQAERDALKAENLGYAKSLLALEAEVEQLTVKESLTDDKSQGNAR